MRRHSILGVVVSFCAFALTTGCKAKSIGADAAAVKPAPKVEASEPVDVSLVELIATPATFAHKRVRVMGFVSLEFEGDAIYLHREDWQHALMRNGIWLDVSGLDGGSRLRTRAGYAIVEGTFDPQKHGHMALFSGSIDNVTRLDAWDVDRSADGGI